MKKLETDVVVAGGGLSGLAAGISAAENGAEVIILEKQTPLVEQLIWEWDPWELVLLFKKGI